MKPRHAAALALVGWYLLGPPIDLQSDEALTDAPLNDWHIMSDTSEKQCMAKHQEAIHTCETVLRKAHLDDPDYIERLEGFLAQAKGAICVRDDDPRLIKEKDKGLLRRLK